jgi:hypothetical protein
MELTQEQIAAAIAQMQATTTPKASASGGGDDDDDDADFLDDVLASDTMSERLPQLWSKNGELDGTHVVRLVRAYHHKTNSGPGFKLEFKIEESSNQAIVPGQVYERFFCMFGKKSAIKMNKIELNTALRVVARAAELISDQSSGAEVSDAVKKVAEENAAKGTVFQIRTVTLPSTNNPANKFTRHYYNLVSEEDRRELGV